MIKQTFPSTEPLYQIYQAKVTEEARQIHTDSPDSYRRSVGETLGLEGNGALGVVGHRTKRGPEEIPLWQDLSVVKESGVLLKLNRTERQRQEVRKTESKENRKQLCIRPPTIFMYSKYSGHKEF